MTEEDSLSSSSDDDPSLVRSDTRKCREVIKDTDASERAPKSTSQGREHRISRYERNTGEKISDL